MQGLVEEAVANCLCQSIGAPKQIRFCAEHHDYWLGDRQLTSVSKVIKTLLPTDFSAVPPDVLETARLRGQAVDFYFSEYLRWGNVTVHPGERSDVVDRLSRLIDWWERQRLEACAVQHTLFSEEDGIAGTCDVMTDDLIIDLKNVSQLQPSYALQLGAYISMDSQKFPLRETAILHVTKDTVKLIHYDSKTVKRQWRNCVSWFNTVKELQ